MLLYVSYLDKIFSYLHSVECSALLNLVAREPEGKTVVVGKVFAHSAYIHIVLACCVERHWVRQSLHSLLSRVRISLSAHLLRVVDEGHALSVAQCLLSSLYGNLFLSLNPYSLRVSAELRDTYAHSRTASVGVHNLPGLVKHLHLFLCITVVCEDINLRNHIVSQLISELVNCNRFVV